MTGKISFILLAACLGIHAAAVAVGNDAGKAKTLRVHFIGNSVTDTVKYRPLAALFMA